jgi:3-methyladenine DNA glycosylase AlkC
MATDMPALARAVAPAAPSSSLRAALIKAAGQAEGQGILVRLGLFGTAVCNSISGFDDAAFRWVTSHKSDVVRQWGAYAVNHAACAVPLAQRLTLTLPFAEDNHMSVRECAWMAFRPHLAGSLSEGLGLLEPVTRAADAKFRRFAIEATRPRSVWGAHIYDLKHQPEMAVALLDNVYQDASRYVRLSAGNWLNDASKSRPDWVRAVCSRWAEKANKHTEAIIRRGLRTLSRQDRNTIEQFAAGRDEADKKGSARRIQGRLAC